MIPASCAVASASPFGSSRSRAAVSGAMRTVARATARRRESGFVADVDHPHGPRLVDVGEVAHRRRYRFAEVHAARAGAATPPRPSRRAPAVEHVDHPPEAVHRLRRRTGTTTAPAARPESRSTNFTCVQLVEPVASRACGRSRTPSRRPTSPGRRRTSRRRRSSRPSPASSRRARRRARSRSRVQTLAPSPNGESFASRTASSSSPNGATVTTGPKISSRSIRAATRRSAPSAR